MKTTKYTMRGIDLFDPLHRRIAYVRGEEIYDGDNRRVGTIRGNYLFDTDNRKMMTVRGGYVYDSDNKQVASLLDAEKIIEGAKKGLQSVALWYCFIR